MSKVFEQLISIIIPIVIIVPFLVSGCNRYNVSDASDYGSTTQEGINTGDATTDCDDVDVEVASTEVSDNAVVADDNNVELVAEDNADVCAIDTVATSDIDKTVDEAPADKGGVISEKLPFFDFVEGSKIFDEPVLLEASR